MSLLSETEHNFVKGLLLLDEKDDIHVFPESAKELVFIIKFVLCFCIYLITCRQMECICLQLTLTRLH